MDYNSSGYILIKNFLDEDDLALFKNIWQSWQEKNFNLQKDQIIVKKTSTINDPNNHVYVKKIENWLQKYTEASQIVDKKITKKVAEVTSNNDIQLLKERFINQSPGMNGYLPHQDCGTDVMPQLVNQMYTAYISLTHTEENSGCIWLEQSDTRRQSSVLNCACVNGETCACNATNIMPEQIKNYKGMILKPILMQPGDMLIFDGWCVHGTACNISDSNRTTVTFAYGVAEPSRDLKQEWASLKQKRENLFTPA